MANGSSIKDRYLKSFSEIVLCVVKEASVLKIYIHTYTLYIDVYISISIKC